MPIDAENTCPFCGVEFEHGASACPSCDLPLLSASEVAGANHHGDRPSRVGMIAVTDRRPRPEYTVGDLRHVVVAMNQAEADMLEGMLRSEGIPCVVRRSNLADIPSISGASMQREILVPEGGLAAARDLLQIQPSDSVTEPSSPLTTAAWMIAGIALVALCVAAVLAFG